jgi:SH3-like domain-containing protein
MDPGRLVRCAWLTAWLSAAILIGWPNPPWVAAAEGQKGPPSATGRPLDGPRVPSAGRFGSLKSDRVEVRQGPGLDHPVLWVYRRAGTPVEFLADSDAWRRIRDAEGAEGWVEALHVSNRRTAIVLPGPTKSPEPAPQIALRSDDSEAAATVVFVEAGVIADIRSCDGRWCFVSVGAFRGWVEQPKLWGLGAGEVIR